MIGIDTNVLVRYVMQDDPAQARAATRFLGTLTSQQPGHVSAAVLAELTWVLKSTYGATRNELANAVETLLAADSLVVEHADRAHRALAALRAAGADFADAFVAAIDQGAGCAETVTFDKDAARRAGMRLLA
ncbi:MAG: PIN domain-containing protein [Vitreimonas sp.]